MRVKHCRIEYLMRVTLSVLEIRRAAVLVGCGCLLLLTCGCGREAPGPAPVTLFAASSTIDALEAIRNVAEESLGFPVTISHAATSRLAKQIEEGAPADLFLSADTQWMDYLAQRGLVLEQRDLLSNVLVVVVPADSPLNSIKSETLASEAIARIAVADVTGVPAGRYAQRALTTLGLWKKVEKKLVPADDVRGALLFCERGEVDAAIVYRTDALRSPNVRVALELDVDLGEPVCYSLAIVGRGEGRPEARALYDFLASKRAEQAFLAHGFIWLNGNSTPSPTPTLND